MTRRTAQRLIRHPLLAALLLAAFCARALIPAGYMPGEGGLVLCPAVAPAPAAPAAPHGMDHGMHAHAHAGHASHAAAADTVPDPVPSPAHDAGALCPFASASAALAAAPAPVRVLALEPVAPPAALPRPTFVPRGTVVPTRLPRGPPPFA